MKRIVFMIIGGAVALVAQQSRNSSGNAAGFAGAALEQAPERWKLGTLETAEVLQTVPSALRKYAPEYDTAGSQAAARILQMLYVSGDPSLFAQLERLGKEAVPSVPTLMRQFSWS